MDQRGEKKERLAEHCGSRGALVHYPQIGGLIPTVVCLSSATCSLLVSLSK